MAYIVFALVNLLAYTLRFGGGVSASLSLEDATTGDTPRRVDGALAGAYGGARLPDLVGRVRVEGGWGSAQVMAAAHSIIGRVPKLGEGEGAAIDRFGFALGAGVTLALPQFGQGDQWSLQAAYADGAIGYVSPDWFHASDYTAANGGLVGTSRAWSVATGLTHSWSERLSTGLTASVASVDHTFGDAQNDYRQLDLGANLVFAPTTGLTFGPELDYRRILPRQAGGRDIDALSAVFRVQRGF